MKCGLVVQNDFSLRPEKQVVAGHVSTNQRIEHKEQRLLEWVLKNAPPNQPVSCMNAIDEFCRNYWMMNVGPDKAKIVTKALASSQGKIVVEVGGYCGYSALLLAVNSPADAVIYSIEINKEYADIAKRIFEHAGLTGKVIVLVGDVQTYANQLKSLKHIDFLFIDHWKDVYLRDFKLIDSFGVLQKGSVVVADNIIYPGAPDYLEY